MVRFVLAAATAICLLFSLSAPSLAARLEARVDISSQTMTVIHRGFVKYRWKVSTARPGKVTPTGSWRPKWLSRHHRSSRYNNAPMPYAIFYSGNYAVHGTYETKRLGTRASSGCIRLHPDNAAILYRLVQREGFRNTRIVVSR